MGEVKNAFIKSKMNKDLDARLIPSGEYRNAVNAQVSKSEGGDVGALENALGNNMVVDFEVDTNVPNLKAIGYLTDDQNNNIYIFLTDNTATSYNSTGVGSNHFIYLYNALNGTVTKLIQGSFLNFSTEYPVTGVNIIESILFWTDNRNQPRKLDANAAVSTPGYYTNEDQISVATYNPYQPIDLWRESELDPGYYESTLQDVVSKAYPNGGTCLVNGTVTASTTIVVDSINGDIPNNAPVSYINSSGDLVDTGVTVSSFAAQTITVSAAVTLADNVELVFYPNPYYESGYLGDDNYLEDKFVRFSYRFKFDNNEYSIFAPFTQIAFIPQQDGYFRQVSRTEPPVDINDQESAYRSTIVEFMENKVNKITLNIPLPFIGTEIIDKLKLSSIDILYKESDALAVQVVETISATAIAAAAGATKIYSYVYKSQKAYKTLPSRDLIRVYDKTPVKALSQEIISNRIVYANYQNKHTPPTNIDYNVSVTAKSNFSIVGGDPSVLDTTSQIEYPNHSLKQNRNYQVGIVLADRYGRQSTTILSKNPATVFPPYNSESVDPQTWAGDSLKILFNNVIDSPPAPALGWPGLYNGDATSDDYNPVGWYSYKVVVKQTEQEYYNVYLPGVINGYPTAASGESPPLTELGRTSHTVLINDNINKVPRDLKEVGPLQRLFRSSVELFGRVENLYLSSEYNKPYYPQGVKTIVSTIATNDDLFNAQGLPPDGVMPDRYNGSIGFYNIDSNPLIGRISTNKGFGIADVSSSTTPSPVIRLAVFETEPVESRLDIFWETTTTGLISELNSVILAEAGGSINIAGWNTSSFNESNAIDTFITSNFTLVDNLGNPIVSPDITSLTMTSVYAGNGTINALSMFELVDNLDNTFAIKTKVGFVYGYNANPNQNYVFTFTAVADISGTSITTSGIGRLGSLGNSSPFFGDSNGDYSCSVTPVSIAPSETTITTRKGQNGADFSANAGNIYNDLTMAIISATNDLYPTSEITGVFSLAVTGGSGSPFSGLLSKISTFQTAGNYTVKLRLTDAGGAYTDCNVLITIESPPCYIYWAEHYEDSGVVYTYVDCSGDQQTIAWDRYGRYPELEYQEWCARSGTVTPAGATQTLDICSS